MKPSEVFDIYLEKYETYTIAVQLIKKQKDGNYEVIKR